mgnify:CR=1 FL=1
MLLNYSRVFDLSCKLFAKYNANRKKALLPLRYFLELTHKCNLKCPYCYLGENKIEEELLLEEWIKVIEQIPFYAFITLVGGEPLLREDFCEILKYASKKTFNKVHLVTNGVLLNDKIIDSIIENKLLLLSVSLDGWKEKHDKKRQAEGIFNKITENLDNLIYNCKIQKKNVMVDIKTIVLEDNLEDILKLYEYSTNKGFEFFSISFLRNNNLKQNPILYENFDKAFYKTKYPIEQYFDLEKFEKIYIEMQKLKKYSKTKIRFAPKFDNDNSEIELKAIKEFFTKNKEKNIKEIYYPCLYPYSNTIINPMGDIYPCLSYKMGNVKEQKLSGIIRNEKYCTFRENLKKTKVFQACQMCCDLKVKVKD